MSKTQPAKASKSASVTWGGGPWVGRSSDLVDKVSDVLLLDVVNKLEKCGVGCNVTWFVSVVHFFQITNLENLQV